MHPLRERIDSGGLVSGRIAIAAGDRRL